MNEELPRKKNEISSEIDKIKSEIKGYNSSITKFGNIIKEIEKVTRKFDRYNLNILCAYSGKLEVLRAIKRMANKKEVLKNNLFNLINDFYKYLDVKTPVDLVIRTGNDKRISDSLVYQCAYAEFCSINKFFPSLAKEDLKNTLTEYSQRKRRFGQ